MTARGPIRPNDFADGDPTIYDMTKELDDALAQPSPLASPPTRTAANPGTAATAAAKKAPAKPKTSALKPRDTGSYVSLVIEGRPSTPPPLPPAAAPKPAPGIAKRPPPSPSKVTGEVPIEVTRVTPPPTPKPVVRSPGRVAITLKGAVKTAGVAGVGSALVTAGSTPGSVGDKARAGAEAFVRDGGAAGAVHLATGVVVTTTLTSQGVPPEIAAARGNVAGAVAGVATVVIGEGVTQYKVWNGKITREEASEERKERAVGLIAGSLAGAGAAALLLNATAVTASGAVVVMGAPIVLAGLAGAAVGGLAMLGYRAAKTRGWI